MAFWPKVLPKTISEHYNKANEHIQSSTNADHSTNGLHLQTCARTAKLAAEPRASPPTRQKLATVAAISTSSLLPRKRGLCVAFGAAIMHMLETYPFDNPKNRSKRKKNVSDPTDGFVRLTIDVRLAGTSGIGWGDDGCWMLQRRKSGMKSVRASESTSRRREDQVSSLGTAQR